VAKPALLVVIAVLVLTAFACDSGHDHQSASPTPTPTSTPTPTPTPTPFLAVLSAFPGEMAPVLEQASIDDEVMIEGRDGRVYRVGTLGGVHVVIGLTGIGLVNAAESTRAILDQFPVTGVVVSAVAGSTLLIGDVTVPQTWMLMDGSTYDAAPAWLALAEEVAAPGEVSLDRCTDVPSKSTEPVCVLGQPVIVVGGLGESSDPFNGNAVPCQPMGNDVAGCDVVPGSTRATFASVDTEPALPPGAADAEAPIAEDMETAAIAREAAARGLPFIAFRAVSDGAGDPLGLPGFPAQFFAYYHLAARNAALATAAFLHRLADDVGAR